MLGPGFPRKIGLETVQKWLHQLSFSSETMFQACDYERTQRSTTGDQLLVPKSKVAGIMVSDFIGEKHGYLQLSDKKFEASVQRFMSQKQEHIWNMVRAKNDTEPQKIYKTNQEQCHDCQI